MMKIKIIITVLALLCGTSALTSCAGSVEQQNSPDESGVYIQDAVRVADPQGAVTAIYDSLDNHVATKLNQAELDKYYGISTGDVLEFYAYRSDPREGLCDIMIVKPVSSSADKVRASLYSYQNERIKEFENYNILFSYEIAQEAVIYDQGDYIIMLMFSDNEAVRAIIDEYIPQ